MGMEYLSPFFKSPYIIKAIRKNTKVTITKLDLAGAWGYDSISKGWVSLKYIKF